MNRILRFIYAALIVSTAVACHTSEIDNPNNDNQDKPKAYDNIILTASIKQTRVDYSINGDKLEQRWAENDVIYGFYGDTKAAKDKKIVFTVNSVDESGVASLSPGDGWSDFLSVYKVGNLAIRLVYTGCTTTELSDLFDANDDILIDMTEQGTDRIPACMHAESYDKRSEGDITYIQFQFDNDCSIIEVFSFTGVKEDHSYISGDSATLGSIQVSNIFETGKYSLDDTGKLTFAGIDSTTDSPATIYFSDDEWKVTTAGDITYAGNIKPVFIAAVPFDTSRDITVSAKLRGGEDSFFNQIYTGRTFEKGNSYYIMANPVVAKTADNVYFKTVKEAFAHAAELSTDAKYDTAAQNVVTLIKKEINGFGEQASDNPHMFGSYDIDYNVTLDLNGCTFILSGSEGFGVYFFDDFSPATFTITDSTGPNSLGKYNGTISSSSLNPILNNSGTATISGGTITSTDGNAIVNYGDLTISGGTITSENDRAVTNYGDLTISGGNLSSSARYVSSTAEGYVNEDSEDYEDQNCRGTIYNWSNLTITGGTIESEYCRALYNSGTTTITGGKVEALDDMAIMNFAELTVGKIPAESNDAISIISGSGYYESDIPAIYCDGGSLDMYYGTVTCPAGAVILENGCEATISGGYFSSTDYSTVQILDGSQCSISGGIISNSSAIAETIQILNGAECTISGGVIYSERDIATIVCRSTSNVSKLWITWPEIRNNEGEITGYDQGSVEGPYEPLIYSFGSAYLSSPISAYNNNENNTAEVYIQGGYLLTHNERDYFFNDGVTPSEIGQTVTELLDNLKLSYCGNFYANSCRINLKGNTDYPTMYGKYLNSYPDTGQKFTISIYDVNYIPDFFDDYFDEEDFASGFPKETVLYYFEYK